jgi:hypothetical protein
MAITKLLRSLATGSDSSGGDNPDADDRCKNTECVEEARCVVISGVPLCLCPDGFLGDGRADGVGCTPMPG